MSFSPFFDEDNLVSKDIAPSMTERKDKIEFADAKLVLRKVGFRRLSSVKVMEQRGHIVGGKILKRDIPAGDSSDCQ